MGLEDLATGVSIDFRITGFDVLVKIPKSLDAASASSDRLTGSLAGLADAFTGLIRPVSTAIDDIMGFTAATTGAAAAARSSAEANRAAAAGMGSTGAAARRAKSEVEDLRATLVATKSAMADLALANAIVPNRVNARSSAPSFGASFASTAAAATEQTAIGAGVSGIASSGFFGSRKPGPPSATVTGYGPFSPGAAMIGGPPVTGTVTRMLGTGGGGGGGIFGGGLAAAAAAGGGGGGGGLGAIAGMGAGLIGRGMPLLGQAAKAGFDATVHAATIGSEIGLGLAADSVYEAGKLQQQMTIMRVASPGLIANTPANNRTMARLQQEAYNVSNATAQSVAQSAELMAVMASSGINDPNQLLAVGKNGDTFAMDIAKFADVQYLKSHGAISFEAAAKQAIKLAHINSAMTPDKIAPLLDEVTKVSFMMPDNLQKYLTQAGYYQKLFGRVGVPQEQTLMLGAWLDRMGGNSKGGTWLQNLLLESSFTGSMSPDKKAAMEHFRLIDRRGKLDPSIFGYDPVTGKPTTQMFNDQGSGLLQRFNDVILRDRAGKSPRAAADAERHDIQLFDDALGRGGQRIPMLADTQGVDVLMKMVQDANHMPGVKAGQQLFMQNFDSQTVRAWSNFQSLLTEVGSQSLPGLTKGFSDLGDQLHNAQAWLHQHGDLERRIQRDITGAVKSTENFIVSNKSTWKTLGNDINLVMTDVEKSGPVFTALGDAVVTAVKVIDVGLNALQLLIPAKSKSGVIYGDDGNDLGARSMLPKRTPPPPPPPATPRGGTVVHQTNHVTIHVPHGPHAKATVAAVTNALKNIGSNHGNIVSTHFTPAALTTPHR